VLAASIVETTVTVSPSVPSSCFSNVNAVVNYSNVNVQHLL